MADYVTPKLVMGYLEVVAPDGEPGIPYDEAVIHLEGDEDSEIEVRCPGALRLAPIIVKAVNNHAEMSKLLAEAADYLNSHSGMDGMDLGNKITQFRRHMQAPVGNSQVRDNG